MIAIGIEKADGRSVLLAKGGNTDDIIKAILKTIPEVRQQTARFSRRFSPDRAGMQALWKWVRDNIRYIEDPLGVQWIREPARLWKDREGDCKSFTVFIVSVLENIGLDYTIRFTNTMKPGGRRVNHVYPVAMLPGGRDVIIDAVYRRFDDEKGYYFSKEYDMPDIYRLSGIGTGESPEETEIRRYYEEVQALSDSLPDVEGEDVTAMSEGDFARYMSLNKFRALAQYVRDGNAPRYAAAAEAIETGRVSGVGSLGAGDAAKIARFLEDTATQTRRAFAAPSLTFPGTVSGVSDWFEKLADAVKKAWRKLVNWIFKNAIPDASPGLLYLFLKEKGGPKTEAKREKQAETLDWIMKSGKFDAPNQVIDAVRIGIAKKFGMTPEQLLEAAKSGRISGIGDVQTPGGYAGGTFTPQGSGGGGKSGEAIKKAWKWIVEIVQKIASLFKKAKHKIDATNLPDLGEYMREEMQKKTPQNTGTPNESHLMASLNWPLFIAIGAGYYLLKN